MGLFIRSVSLLFVTSAFFSGAILGAELKSAAGFQTDRGSICTSEWTKRGVLDRSMYDYCIGQHVEAYSELVLFHEQHKNDGWYTEYAYPYCNGEWTKRGVSNATMMQYCLNQEIEGVRDYRYYLEQHDADVVNQIANRAMTAYKSWNMVAYQIKQQFD